MTFQDAVRRVLMEKYADFNGRARRSEFWWFFLFTVIVSIVASILDRILGTNFAGAYGVIYLIVWLAMIVPTLAVGARRLHDTGKSGWLQLLNIIPCIGFIILIVFYVQDSQPDNKYGPSPKGGGGFQQPGPYGDPGQGGQTGQGGQGDLPPGY